MFRLILGAVCFLFFFGSSSQAHDTNSCGNDLGTLGEFERSLHKGLPRCVLPSHAGEKLKDVLLATPNLSAESEALLRAGANPLMATKEMVDLWVDVYASYIEKAGLGHKVKDNLLDALQKARADLHAKVPSANLWKAPGPIDAPIEVNNLKTTVGKQLTRHLQQKAFVNCVKHTSHLFVVSNIINAGGAVVFHWKEYAGADSTVVQALFNAKFYRRMMRDERFIQNVTWNAVFMTGFGALACLRNQTLGYWGLVAFAAASAIVGQLPTGISLRQTLTNVGYISTVSYWKGRLSLWAVEEYQKRDYPYPKSVETLIWILNEGAGSLIYPAWDDLTRQWCNDPAPPTSNKP